MKLSTKLFALLALGCASLVGCNSNPVVVNDGTSTTLVYAQDGRADEAGAVDILWIIDDSGSMAEEQSALAANFDLFAKNLTQKDINFQIGVTTTDVQKNGKNSPKGKLLHVPRPGIGFFSIKEFSFDSGSALLSRVARCVADEEAFKNRITADLTAINGASVDWDQIAANLDNDPLGKTTGNNLKDVFAKYLAKEKASHPSKTDDVIKDAFFKSLMPSDSEFDTFPPFLKSETYFDPNTKTYNTDKLKRDFSCISLVGTAGWGVERGIDALLQATDPEKYKKGGDNFGFIRPKSKFAFIIVSDENDCSHTDEVYTYQGKQYKMQENICVTRICDMLNLEGIPEGLNPLVSVQEAKTKLLENLRAIKGDSEYPESSIVASAVTGTPNRIKVDTNKDGDRDDQKYTSFDVSDPQVLKLVETILGVDVRVIEYSSEKSKCGENFPFLKKSTDPQYNDITCNSEYGNATSGDRYQRFIESFDNYYPDASSVAETGLICQGNLQSTLSAISTVISKQISTCITRVLPGCGEGVTIGEQCGPTDLKGVCTAIPNSNNQQSYCSSALRVLLVDKSNSSTAEQTLQSSNYCLPGTIGSYNNYNWACIMDPDKYNFDTCGVGVRGLRFNFVDKANYKNNIGTLAVEISYVAYPSEYPEN